MTELPPKSPLAAWLDRPVGWGPRLVVLALLLAAPAWLLSDPLESYRLKADDFIYIAESRTATDLRAHLLTPLNSHVVPLFRLGTYLLIAGSGGLARLPVAFGLAAYAALVLAMLATRHLVAWESRDQALGLAAMSALGLSTVMAPSVLWYSASQAIWAGTAVLAMLLAFQGWRARGSAWRLVPGLVAAAAAPLLWSAGYIAGPVGFAYLWADGRPRCRKAALLPLFASLATAILVLTLAGRQVAASANFHERSLGEAIRPWSGALHTAQAIPEVLVLANLGLDAATTAPQGVVSCLALAVVWAWSRGVPLRPNPLEAAGAAIVALGFLMVYTARGYLPFDSLRGLGWYQAIPEIGAVVFATGWWAGRLGSPPPVSLRPPSRRGVLGVLALAVVLLVLQSPRAHRIFLESVYPLSKSERRRLATPGLRRYRALCLASETAERQREFLARLGRAERDASLLGVGRAEVREAVGRIIGPGMPERIPGFDAVNLLALPETGTGAGPPPARVRAALRAWFKLRPEARPPWLDTGEPWPPIP